VYAIYDLDPVTKNLVQAITLRRLIAGDPAAPVLSVARPGRLITVSPIMDREDVARLISKYDLLAVPVVDHGRVIGIVTVDDIMDTPSSRKPRKTFRSWAAWRRSTNPIWRSASGK